LWDIVKRLWEFVRFYWRVGSTAAQDSYWKGPHCRPPWVSANEIGLDLYSDGIGKSSSDIFWSLDQRISCHMDRTCCCWEAQNKKVEIIKRF
jgi:hypothetical protein